MASPRSLANGILSHFDDIDPMSPSHVMYPGFDLRGLACGISPRSEQFAYMLNMGKNQLERVFAGLAPDREHVTLVFPERWLSPIEEQHMIMTFHRHPGPLKRLDVLTASTMILTDFTQDRLLVVTEAAGGDQ